MYRPVGSNPINAPWWVPLTVFLTATRSPSEVAHAVSSTIESARFPTAQRVGFADLLELVEQASSRP